MNGPNYGQFCLLEMTIILNVKIIQVAKMHGELLEFNDVLKKQLLICESQLKRVTNELVSLRGPVSMWLVTDG